MRLRSWPTLSASGSRVGISSAGRLSVDDLDREARRVAKRHEFAAAGVLAALDAARPVDAREALELLARAHGEARADEARLRRAMHAIAVRRRRGPAHREHVVRTAREQEAEVGEELLRAREVGALEHQVGERRSLGRRVRVPRRLRRPQLVHGSSLPPNSVGRMTNHVHKEHNRQVDKFVQDDILSFETMATHKARRRVDHRTRVGRERSARTETRILEAALGVFADMGPDAPKIDDFVQAAGISRGTFYNHFESVEELLAATSEWTTRQVIETIEAALEGIEGPALRFGVGLRLFFAKAQADPVWCRFVARVWKARRPRAPRARSPGRGSPRCLPRAERRGRARSSSSAPYAKRCLRIGSERTPAAYGAHMTELCLQALGTDARRIAAILSHELPPLPSEAAREREDGLTG